MRYLLETRNVHHDSTREWHSRNPFQQNRPWVYADLESAQMRAAILLMGSATHTRIIDTTTGDIVEMKGFSND